MRKLGLSFGFDPMEVEDKIREVVSSLDAVDVDAGRIRKLVCDGFQVKKLEPLNPKREVNFISCDSALAVKKLMYHCLWSLNAVSVSACFDGNDHRDVLSGNGTIPYKNLEYDNLFDAGELSPYSDIEPRMNAVRVVKECILARETARQVSERGVDVDFLLYDGSLHTTLENIRGDGHPEFKKAHEYFMKTLTDFNMVGTVEDSHSCDASARLGLSMTNLSMFDIALKPLEYASMEYDGVFVHYIKLPGKKVEFKQSKQSTPMTVRWETTRKTGPDLEVLAHMWMAEDDILHPQHYPMRVADHLSRKIKVGGILERIIGDKGLKLQYRENRKT